MGWFTAQDMRRLGAAWRGGVAGACLALASHAQAGDGSTGYRVDHRFIAREGITPSGGLVSGLAGQLYGVTEAGGAGPGEGCGTIYAVDPSSGREHTLHRFTGEDGEGCLALGTLWRGPDGSLFGATYNGGSGHAGTLFSLAPDGTFTTLHAFSGDADGQGPNGSLVRAADGRLYGTTAQGGAHGRGTVFALAPDGTFQVLHAFRHGDPLGEAPASGLTVGAGNVLFGTAADGAFGVGTVYRVDMSGTLGLVHAFKASEGTFLGSLTAASDGALVGVAVGGGAEGAGTLFHLQPDGQLVTLHDFSGGVDDGAAPRDAPIEVSVGVFYGTTLGNGDDVPGTVYRFDVASSSMATLHRFGRAPGDGRWPVGPLAVGADGRLHGATMRGGNLKLQGQGTGTVFRVGG